MRVTHESPSSPSHPPAQIEAPRSSSESCLCRPDQGQRVTRVAAAFRGEVAPPREVREPRWTWVARSGSPAQCSQSPGRRGRPAGPGAERRIRWPHDHTRLQRGTFRSVL